MKIRWRQYEMFLSTLTFCSYVTASLQRWATWTKEIINNIYGDSFTSVHLPFSFFKNVQLPEIGQAALLLAAHLYINLAALGKIKIRWQLTNVLIRIALPFLAFGAGFSLANFFKHEYLYRSPIGYTLPLRRAADEGFLLTVQLLVSYGAYLFLRELYIRYLERPAGKLSYRILIANQVGLILVLFVLGLAVIVMLQWPMTPVFWTGYWYFLPPAIIIFFTNLYWLFPLTQNAGFFSPRVLTRWAGSVTVIILPFCFFSFLHTKDIFDFLLVSYVIHLGVITPLSWLAYLQQKDRILELRGLRAALGRSTADLQFLRSQINPHFLFNTLNSLYGTALQESAGRTAEGIQRLGDMMRFMLHENHLEKIPINKEMEYLKNYIALQHLRIVDSPETMITSVISEPEGDFMITPMLLIPFVENAFKHGISMHSKSWIAIDLRADKSQLFFDVRNSIHQRSEPSLSSDESGIGLENVRQRLQLAYPGKHQMHIYQSATEYVVHLIIDRE
jgi:two-component system, LytTR family, sensor kinase